MPLTRNIPLCTGFSSGPNWNDAEGIKIQFRCNMAYLKDGSNSVITMTAFLFWLCWN